MSDHRERSDGEGRRAYEEQGIIRNGAKLINAVSNSTVPAITIMMGGSYGAGNYAMYGRAYEPRFLFRWPNHRIAVMGPQQLSGVMDLIKRDAAARRICARGSPTIACRFSAGSDIRTNIRSAVSGAM